MASTSHTSLYNDAPTASTAYGKAKENPSLKNLKKLSDDLKKVQNLLKSMTVFVEYYELIKPCVAVLKEHGNVEIGDHASKLQSVMDEVKRLKAPSQTWLKTHIEILYDCLDSMTELLVEEGNWWKSINIFSRLGSQCEFLETLIDSCIADSTYPKYVGSCVRMSVQNISLKRGDLLHIPKLGTRFFDEVQRISCSPQDVERMKSTLDLQFLLSTEIPLASHASEGGVHPLGLTLFQPLQYFLILQDMECNVSMLCHPERYHHSSVQEPLFMDFAGHCRSFRRELLRWGCKNPIRSCVYDQYYPLLDFLQCEAYGEIRFKVFRAVGRHLPLETVETIFEWTLHAEELPLNPRIYRTSVKNLLRRCYWRDGDRLPSYQCAHPKEEAFEDSESE